MSLLYIKSGFKHGSPFSSILKLQMSHNSFLQHLSYVSGLVNLQNILHNWSLAGSNSDGSETSAMGKSSSGNTEKFTPSLTQRVNKRSRGRTCTPSLMLPSAITTSFVKAQQFRKHAERTGSEEKSLATGTFWRWYSSPIFCSQYEDLAHTLGVCCCTLFNPVSLWHWVLHLWITNLLTFDICISFHLINRSFACQGELLWKISTAMGMPKRSLNHIRKTMCS